ncbi:hypothetical protein KC573_02475 [candidate division WWE3 bacterium]|uniref:Uncharacterized protein n=1 Tax=candidate division WWE3 bacterium TaxID=2053526 RepID=A0A955LW83_UNCKA|nr:hypothetical protein [candidate division WWE3 bacterium]
MGTNSKTQTEQLLQTQEEETTTAKNTQTNDYYCPECGTGPVAFQEGCFLCYACGYSKCS